MGNCGTIASIRSQCCGLEQPGGVARLTEVTDCNQRNSETWR